MSAHLPFLAFFFVLSVVVNSLGVSAIQSTYGNRATEELVEHQASLQALALHNISPFLVSDNRLAIQAELDYLVAQTALEFAAVQNANSLLIAASGQRISDQEILDISIDIASESAGTLQLAFAKTTTPYGQNWKFSGAIALVISSLLTLALSLFLSRRTTQLNSLIDHLDRLLNHIPTKTAAHDKLRDAISFLNRQLGGTDDVEKEPLDESIDTNSFRQPRLVALFSTIQLSEWQRATNHKELDDALKRFEDQLRLMLDLYSGELLVIDDHRIVVNFGEVKSRHVRQAIIFSMGVLQILTAHASPLEGVRLPLCGSLTTLHSRSGLLSFMHANHSILDAHFDELQRLQAGQFLVDESLVDSPIETLIESATSTNAGVCIEAIKPTVLSLWQNQHHRIEY